MVEKLLFYGGKIAVLWWKNGCFMVEKWLCSGGKTGFLMLEKRDFGVDTCCLVMEKCLFYSGRIDM